MNGEGAGEQYLHDIDRCVSSGTVKTRSERVGCIGSVLSIFVWFRIKQILWDCCSVRESRVMIPGANALGYVKFWRWVYWFFFFLSEIVRGTIKQRTGFAHSVAVVGEASWFSLLSSNSSLSCCVCFCWNHFGGSRNSIYLTLASR